MENREFRVLVLGLDGATFDLMLPWIDEGHLPCLGGLIKNGSQSPLESTIPPITPCAWSSFMTGMNPGKHGLFDFVEPTPDGSFHFTNASSRHAQTLWGYLSAQNRRVGVINVPMTYPPEPVNGYMISGNDMPDERSPYMYPTSLRQELSDAGIKYRIDPRYFGYMKTDRRRDRWLRELCAVETIRVQALTHLRQVRPTEFTMVVFYATDPVQHHFWHFMDRNHDKFDKKKAGRFGLAIRDVYITMDRLIASALKGVGEDTIVIIMSDHGFGPVRNMRIRINQALERVGLLTFADRGSSSRALRLLAGAIDRCLRSTLSPTAKRWLASLFPKLHVWFENLDEAHVDWNRTVAAANEVMRNFPAVFLKRSELLQGATECLSREEAILAVEQALRDLRDPQTGNAAITQVYRTRDLYHGPYADKAPDLIPSWWIDGFLLEQSIAQGAASSIVERSKAPVNAGIEFAGSHRMNGVFIMAGGPTRRGFAFETAKIIDVAPTILYLMGVPIPAEMDGQPLLQAIDPEFVAAHPPAYQQSDNSAQLPPESAGSAFTKEEEQLVHQRLKAMGYL